MRTLALLVALTGCNQVFSLDKTQLVDAGTIFFDAPPEPPHLQSPSAGERSRTSVEPFSMRQAPGSRLPEPSFRMVPSSWKRTL